MEISFAIPLTPPGVNNYVRHTRSGRHYVTSEALAFKKALVLLAPKYSLLGTAFEVEIVVFFGRKQKGDADGFAKLVLDGLEEAGMFMHPNRAKLLSDAHVTDVIQRKRRDPVNPRTEITVRAR